MDRRRFLLTSLAGAFATPLAAEAQQAGKMYRIGVMFVGSAGPHVYLDAFRQGLRELGWMEGKNIELEVRAAEGKYERLPAIAAELVRLRVDIIFAPNTPTVVAAKKATTSIPIVMAAVDDPVGRGFVGSLSRPGGNITGLTMQEQDIFAKQLQFLKEVVPKVSRVSVLQTQVDTAKGLEEAAKSLRIQLQVLTARSREEFDDAFSSMVRGRADALLVVPTPLFLLHRTRLVELAAKARLPTMHGAKEYAEAGGLMAYGTNYLYNYRHAAVYVDKILKGAKAADLPVEQPTKFELVINLKTAKALGLTIPPSLLGRADQVIE
jgi:putative ABC transport system substrate-binding protein